MALVFVALGFLWVNKPKPAAPYVQPPEATRKVTKESSGNNDKKPVEEKSKEEKILTLEKLKEYKTTLRIPEEPAPESPEWLIKKLEGKKLNREEHEFYI